MKNYLILFLMLIGIACSKKTKEVEPILSNSIECTYPSTIVKGYGGSINSSSVDDNINNIAIKYFFGTGHYLGWGNCNNSSDILFLNFDITKPDFIIPVNKQGDSIKVLNFKKVVENKNITVNFKGRFYKDNNKNLLEGDLELYISSNNKVKRQFFEVEY